MLICLGLRAVVEASAIDPVRSCSVLCDTQRNMRKGEEDDVEAEEEEERLGNLVFARCVACHVILSCSRI